MMDDRTILNHIESLVSEEHGLFERHTNGDGLSEDERKRMDDLNVQLDRYYDLLRQRRARREAGEDPDEAKMRSATTVERYLQ
jgi:hypothetical protein